MNAKVHAQIDRLEHVSTVFANEPQVALAQETGAITPGGALRKSFFTNSGTEANETAILAARCYTGSTEIIALRHSYHGRSSRGDGPDRPVALETGPACRPASSTRVNAIATAARSVWNIRPAMCNARRISNRSSAPRLPAASPALIAEPIQGVGGFITPPKEYFKIVTEIVRKYGGLFIADEVQTAWGRTGGKWFGIEHWGVQPDIITSAKGLGNGLPIGVTIARPEVADAMKGVTISTFGGNPVVDHRGQGACSTSSKNRT